MAAQAEALQVVEFGPIRAIGLSMIARGGDGDFVNLWRNQLFPRRDEVTRPERAAALGVCRCVPGATDGTFEYLAMFQCTDDCPTPAGMLALTIPQTHYAVFPVAGLPDIGAGWHRAHKAVGDQTAWKPYCGPDGCECAEHPAFEYHAWDSRETGKVLIYVPVKRP